MSARPNVIPWTFFASNGVALSNYTSPKTVLISDPIPQGHRGFLRDVNTIFTTSGGTIAYDKVSSSGGSTRFAAGITANSNGSFDLVLGAGDRVAIVITTDGVGVLDVAWDGELQEVPFPSTRFKTEPFLVDDIGIAAGGGL